MRDNIRATLPLPLCDYNLSADTISKGVSSETLLCGAIYLRTQVRCWISGRVTLAFVGVLNWIWKADCQELPLSLRDPICVHVGFLNGITINTFEKMSKISKMFKVSSSSSSSRPSSSSGSSSRSKHRSRSGPSPQEAINRLRETEAMLTKKQEYLESRIEQELTIAKKNGTKNKRGV